jgi:hypothetical protein
MVNDRYFSSLMCWGRSSLSWLARCRYLLLLLCLAVTGDGISSASAAALAPGAVVGWGNNFNGQINIPADLKGVTAIAAGGLHSLALKNDGKAVAWGNNSYGQLNIPNDLAGVIAIAAGLSHNLALKNDGKVVGWGNNGFRQINIPNDLAGVTAIAAGGSHSLALKNDGKVVAWGSDNSGQSSVPFGLSNVIAIAAGSNHSLALKSDGAVISWGANYDQVPFPTGLSNITAIAAGGLHNLAANLTSAPIYTLSGFLPPVNNPDVVNLGKAGRTYPIKWQLKDAAGNFVTSLAAIKSITFKPVQCGVFTSVQADALEAETSGNSGLTYDDTSNQYRYNWATPPAGCYVLFLSFDTGQVQQAYFNLRN